MRGARDRFDPGWWSGSYSSSSAAAAHGPRSCGTRMRPFQQRSMPSSLLLRVFNVVLLLSCSTAGITAHSAGVASAQADDRAQDSSAAPSASTLRSGAELAVSKGEHDKALRLFAQVIELEPKNERNFYKRFRVYLAKRKYAEAIFDLSRALELKPKYKQALAQRAKLLRMVGKCEEAVRDYAALEAIDPANGDLASFYPLAKSCAERLAEAAAAESRGNWQAAADAYDAVIDEQLDLVGTALFMQRARCHFALKRWLQAAADAGRAAKLAAEGDMDQGGSGARERAEALELRGRCYIQLGDFEMAANHFREVLMDDPDNGPCREEHKRCRGVVKKLEAGAKLLEAGDTEGATREWRSASTMEPDNPLFVGPLLLRIGSAHFDSKNWGEAKRAAQECLNVHPNGEHGVRAEIMVGDVHVEAEEFQEAVHVYGKAEQKAKEMDDQELLENARQKLKKGQVFLEQSKKKDYYKILGISRNADQAQIKKAYRELAKIHHPDKVQGEEEKEKSNKIFQDIAEAYEVLSDDELRGKYDRGEEVFDNQGGGGESHGGPHWHFSHGGRPRHFQRTHVRFG